MASQHERAVNLALDTGERIGRLIDRLGTTDAPSGAVLRAYRLARRALVKSLDNPDEAAQVLRDLRESVRESVRDVLERSATLGATQADREAAIYNLEGGDGVVINADPTETPLIEDAMNAVGATLDAQVMGALGLITAGDADESLILGDEERAGMLTPAPIVRDAARWGAVLTGFVYSGRTLAATSGGVVYGRQAVAAIDERTTDCCLRVNGQIVPMEGEFELTGTPRFADRMKYPPFHWYCRTASALVRLSIADDALTASMRDAARAELRAREDGSRVEIHPAHSTSRRG